MKEMAADEFQTRCLALIDEVEKSDERVVISKAGRRVAELIRYRGLEEEAPQATLRGTAHVHGGLVGHAVEPETWRSLG